MWTENNQLLPFAKIANNKELVYLFNFGFEQKLEKLSLLKSFGKLVELTRGATRITAIWPTGNVIYLAAAWPKSYKVLKIEGSARSVNDEETSEFWDHRYKGTYWDIDEIMLLCKYDIEDMPNIWQIANEQYAIMSDGRIFNWMEYEPAPRNVTLDKIKSEIKKNTCIGEEDFMGRLEIVHPELGLLAYCHKNGQIQYVHDIFTLEGLPTKNNPWVRCMSGERLKKNPVISLVARTAQ